MVEEGGFANSGGWQNTMEGGFANRYIYSTSTTDSPDPILSGKHFMADFDQSQLLPGAFKFVAIHFSSH